MQVNNNGLISFSQSVSAFTRNLFTFPLGSQQLIAPYWGDVDTREIGTVWFRETNDPAVIRRTMRDVQMAFSCKISFQPLFTFIATWDRVGYYRSHSDLVSIHIMLRAKLRIPNAIYIYEENAQLIVLTHVGSTSVPHYTLIIQLISTYPCLHSPCRNLVVHCLECIYV